MTEWRCFNINILDLIYPPTCAICGKLDRNSLCKKCEIRLTRLALFRIEDYKNITSNFEEHLFIFHYDGIIRQIILDYKFNEKTYIYKTFVNFLKKNEKMYIQIKKYDIIMPIPISKKRFKQRGYNQSSLFARDLANKIGVQYLNKVLLKIKNNPAQSSLSKDEREENVKNVYIINTNKKKEIKGKKILLVDDIFTTGNTANECSRILMENGALNVGVLTIAKD